MFYKYKLVFGDTKIEINVIYLIINTIFIIGAKFCLSIFGLWTVSCMQLKMHERALLKWAWLNTNLIL